MSVRYDVFISYTKQRHGPAARLTAASLASAGYKVWFDRKDPKAQNVLADGILKKN